LLTACDSDEKKAVITPFTFPEDTAVIYRINDKDNFLSVIANNSFWKQHNPHSFRLHEVKILNTLPTDENLWVAFSADGHFFAVTPHITNDSLSIWKKANDKVQKQAQFGKEWFYTLQGDYLIIGDTDKVGSYAQPKDKPLTTRQQDLEALQKLSNNECAASIFLSQEGANTYFRSFFGTDVLPNNNNWVTFDLFLEENNVRFSGISLIDKENNTSDCMLRTQPYQNTLIDHLPARVLKLTAYSFDDADLISLPDSLAQQSPFLTSVNGIAFAQTLDGYFAVASTYTVDDLMSQLNDNALKASNDHKGEYVRITGNLSTIDSSGKYISLLPNTDFAIIGVTCYIKNEETKAKVSELSSDSLITLTGKITEVGEVLGYSLDIDNIE